MTAAAEVEVSCPKCGGRMWDNRLSKRNAKAPDFKCRDRACDGVVWPEKGAKAPAARTPQPTTLGGPAPFDEDEPQAPSGTVDLTPIAYLYGRCLAKARTLALEAKLDTLNGDTAGAVAAIAATLFIQANKQ